MSKQVIRVLHFHHSGKISTPTNTKGVLTYTNYSSIPVQFCGVVVNFVFLFILLSIYFFILNSVLYAHI